MKRALFFLIIALFMALIVQPNLSTLSDDDVKVPQDDSTAGLITNDNIDMSKCESQAIICLDAANGGLDYGYYQEDHLPEKDVNLEIVQAIGEYLTKADYKVVYTRTGDEDVNPETGVLSFEERINYAKGQNALYMISIQCNEDTDILKKGFSLFTHPNDLMIAVGNSIYENLSAINYSQFEGLDSDHYSNFPILNNEQIPTIMIDIGYLTNEEDYNNLTNPEFQKKIGKAIAMAILKEIN